MSNPYDEILGSINQELDAGRIHMEVEQAFFAKDDNKKAFELSVEALQKGYTNPLYHYVIGFCFNNGLACPMDKEQARKFFVMGAEYKNSNGVYDNNKYADECRVIISQEFVKSHAGDTCISVDDAIKYCKLLLNSERHSEDAAFYLLLIYGYNDWGHYDADQAMKYAEMLLHSENPTYTAEAQKVRAKIEKSRKKGFFSRIF